MGGNVFESTSSLNADEIFAVKDSLNELFDKLNIKTYTFIGSSVNQKFANDIDVLVLTHLDSLHDARAKLFLTAQMHLGENNVKKLGQAISICCDVPNSDKKCQIDIIPCHNIQNSKWLMRGLWRHMLLALLAKDESERMSEDGYEVKITLTIPDGVQVLANKVLIQARTCDPEKIVLFIGLTIASEVVNPNSILDLKSLAEAVVKCGRSPLLKEYEDYVEHLKDKPGYQEAIRIIKEVQLAHHT